jgi:chemotaxis protein methyltransferase CheR
VTSASSTNGGSAFGDREFRYTPRDFRRIADYLYEDAGIALSDTKAPLVYARLVKRIRALGLESFSRYCALVNSAEGADERARMTDALTTNVTRFFREPHHFAHLRNTVLPPLLDGIRKGGRLRIWSAGCSSGEEPYSIALSILAMMPDAASFDVRVLATDINAQMIAHGAQGIYSEAAVTPVDRQMRADWFVPVRSAEGGRSWKVGPAMSKLVSFRELNLTKAWPMTATYHVIFCRNVLIYFEEQDRIRIWRRMAPLLAPDGRLYIGHSERVYGADSMYALEAPTTYRRLAGDAE